MTDTAVALVTTVDTDFGLIPADQAQVIADETGQAVTLRHPAPRRHRPRVGHG
jgi:hypothetical protein